MKVAPPPQVLDFNHIWKKWFYDLFAYLDNGELIIAEQTPASASATGVKGTIVYDSSYIYICVDTDTWERAALSTW